MGKSTRIKQCRRAKAAEVVRRAEVSDAIQQQLTRRPRPTTVAIYVHHAIGQKEVV